MSVEQDQIHDVAVVGAGPAGLTAAIALVDAGLSVALIAPETLAEDWRTTALLGASVDFLDRLGAWQLMSAHAAPLKTMRLIDGTRRLIRAPEVAFHASEVGRDAFGYNVPNTALTGGLAQEVARRGDSLRRVPALMTAIDLGERQATITTSRGETIKARLVVAADGRKSLVREAAGIKLKSWSYPQTALVLNLEHSGPHNDTSTEFHTETGPFTLVPLDRRRSSLVCIEKPEVAERLSALDDAALATELERRSHSLLGRLKIASPRQCWPMSGFKAETLAGRRVVLIGEAAHGFPPIGAQGFNLSLRDIGDLADIAVRFRGRGDEIGGAEFIDRYQSSRQRDVASRVYGVDLLNRSLLSDLLPVQAVRAIGLEAARVLPPFRKLLMREGLGAAARSIF
ncbi:UbiH/UbiF family hydroxylase [Oryzibacter oryziterrae]|uniref:UbiH/UbiF family hydroxylase n=1 Tax=Oryzibacter oryziterrae TaxID=2766474 RepID=UPI001F2D5B21|nr:UbiH/UbiF family hydroxylase [Oryzibacter oryziterrae]